MKVHKSLLGFVTTGDANKESDTLLSSAQTTYIGHGVRLSVTTVFHAQICIYLIENL